MHPDDVVDWTIRNQRYRSWPGWLGIAGWGGFWVAAAAVIETQTPYGWRFLVFPATFFLIVGTWTPLMIFVARLPVRRLRLGEELWGGRYRFAPKDVHAIRLTPDPEEDYVESKLPIVLCQVTVEGGRGLPIRLVVSAGDAARLREWAGRYGILVDDPHGFSARGMRQVPR